MAADGGVRVKLPKGVSWEQLASMSPDDIRAKDLFPGGFLPLPGRAGWSGTGFRLGHQGRCLQSTKLQTF